MEYTEEKLELAFDNLPADVREAMSSINTTNVVKNLGKKYSLHTDKVGELAEEIGLFMLGFTRPTDFLTQVQTRLGVPLETAGDIVKDVNIQLFFPIRESLKKIHHPEEQRKYEPEAAPKVENFSPAGQVTEESIPKEEPAINEGNNAVIVNEQPPDDKPANNRSVFDEKMSKLFRLPKEEVEIKNAKTVRPPTPVKPVAPTDPYHEPID